MWAQASNVATRRMIGSYRFCFGNSTAFSLEINSCLVITPTNWRYHFFPGRQSGINLVFLRGQQMRSLGRHLDIRCPCVNSSDETFCSPLYNSNIARLMIQWLKVAMRPADDRHIRKASTLLNRYTEELHADLEPNKATPLRL